MEVTMVHPDNKEQKVVVAHEQQYTAYKKMGFEDVPEKQKDNLKAAKTPAVKVEPAVDAPKETPEDAHSPNVFNHKKETK